MKRYLLLAATATLFSCSLLPDGGFFGGSNDPKEPAPTTAVGEVLNETTDLLVEFRWWMLLAILFFPQARTAVSTFIQTVFSALTVPFQMVREWHKAKMKR